MSHTAVDLRRARIALTISFIGNGFLAGTLVSRTADIKHALHLSAGGLGTALLMGALASLLWMAIASRWVQRWGSGPVTAVAIGAYCASFPLLGFATTVPLLWTAFVAYGIVLTTHEVAMNSHAVTLEHAGERRIMSMLHATWSIGTLCGAGVGGLLSQRHLQIGWHFAVTATVVALVGVGMRSWLLPGSADHASRVHASEKKKRFQALPGVFVALGLIGLCEQVGEGGAGNWGAVLARESFRASPFLATLPYIGFSVVMIVGRLTGDRLANRFGARTLLVASGLIIASGLGLGMALDSLTGEVIAWLFLGAGCSNVIPLLFSATGRMARASSGVLVVPSAALALVTAISYSGSLVGPPMIGYLADATSLHRALEWAAILGLFVAGGTLLVFTRDSEAVH